MGLPDALYTSKLLSCAVPDPCATSDPALQAAYTEGLARMEQHLDEAAIREVMGFHR